MSEYLPGLIWLVILLLANAFFVGAEFAVVSARRSQIEPRAERGSRPARTALYAMEHATLMLATSQLGITICSLIILNVSEPSVHHLLEAAFGQTALTADQVEVIAFAVALGVVTFLHVVFGEMVPKNLSFSVPDRAVLILAPPLVFISRVFSPIITALNWLANGIVRLFRVEPKDEATSTYTLEEVATIVEQSTREGVLEDTTGALTNAFEFTAKKVRDVEVPWADIVTLPADRTTPTDIREAVSRYGYSRYLLTDGEDRPVGYVHLKDVLDLTDAETADQPLPRRRVRQLTTVLRDADLEDAFTSLRRRGSHMARSFDREGRVTGVLFWEDIVEVLVGEVDDQTNPDRATD